MCTNIDALSNFAKVRWQLYSTLSCLFADEAGGRAQDN